MARTVYQYKPINDTPDVAVGIILPFNTNSATRTESQNYASGSSNGGSVFSLSYTTEEQSLSNLKNLLLTSKGERVMQPNFGTNIRKSVFEQNINVLRDNLSQQLQADIEYWLPYIIINGIDIFSIEHTINITIRFKVSETGANLVINVLASENQLILSNIAPDLDIERQLVAVGTFSRGIL
jgi:phage baseplate assembly protein W